jgi:subtilisin-like proprotein convertase family protein
LSSKQTIEVTNDTDVTLATNGDTTTIDLNITNNISIEWVGVYLDVNLDNSGDYEYNLISPAGTTTQLLHGNNALNLQSPSLDDTFRLSSVAFLDENSSGDWKLEITDKNTNNNPTNKLLRGVKLEIVGY